MLGVGWPELMVIAVVTVLVVGPKELPRVLRTVMQLVGKARAMAGEFQSGMDQLARESDFDDLRKEAQKLEKSGSDMTNDFNKSLDGDNAIAGMFTGSVIGTNSAGSRAAPQVEKPAEQEVRVAGMTPASGPLADVPAPAPSNVVPAPAPKKDVVAVDNEQVSLEKRRAGGA